MATTHDILPAHLIEADLNVSAPQTEHGVTFQSFTVAPNKRPSPTLSVKKLIPEITAQEKQRGDLMLNLSVGQLGKDLTPTEEQINRWKEQLQADAKEKDDPEYSLKTGQETNLYAPAPGIPGLRAAMAKRFSEDTGLSAKMGNVGVSTGGKGAMTAVLDHIVAKEKVIVFAPGWPTNFDAFRPGVEVVIADTDGRGIPTPEQLQGILKAHPDARAVLLNAPNNPTGQDYSAGEREKIAEVLNQHINEHNIQPGRFSTYWDEPYSKLSFAEGTNQKRGEEERKLLDGGYGTYFWTMSKEYGMPGKRVGFAISNDEPIKKHREELLDQFKNEIAQDPQLKTKIENYYRGSIEQLVVHNQNESKIPSIDTQVEMQATLLYGTKEFIYGRDSSRPALLDTLRENRDLMADMLSDKEAQVGFNKPGGSIYGWPDFSEWKGKWIPAGSLLGQEEPLEIKTPDDLQRFMSESVGIVGVPGPNFYGPHCPESWQFRMSFAPSQEVLKEAMFRIQHTGKNLAENREAALDQNAITPMALNTRYNQVHRAGGEQNLRVG